MRHQQYEKDGDNKNYFYKQKAQHLETAKEEYIGPGAWSDVYHSAK